MRRLVWTLFFILAVSRNEECQAKGSEISPSLLGESKVYFERALKKNPQSESLRLEFAILLFRAEELADCEVQLDIILTKSPKHEDARRLKDRIQARRAKPLHSDELYNLGQKLEDQVAVLKFNLRDQEPLKLEPALRAELNEVPPSLLAEAKQSVAQHEAEIKKLFQSEIREGNIVADSMDIVSRMGIANRYGSAGDLARELSILKRLVAEYPNSAATRADLIYFYVSNDRLADAEKFVTAELLRLPGSPMLQSLKNSLAKCINSSSAETRAAAKSDLELDLGIWHDLFHHFWLDQNQKEIEMARGTSGGQQDEKTVLLPGSF